MGQFFEIFSSADQKFNFAHNVGNGNDEFSIEFHHGGFFVGSGGLKSYVDEKVNWFDGIKTET